MDPIVYRPYRGEADLPHIVALVQNELSEPYVVYTYRYFLHQWPHLSYLAYPPSTSESDSESAEPIGVIVCKQSMHRDRANRGYIAMLSVSKSWRKRGIASALVRHSIGAMKADGVEEVVLETEHDNAAALALYASLGFVREKRLYRFYLNGKDAFRLVLAVNAAARTDGDAAENECTPAPYRDSESDEDEDRETARVVRLRRKVATLRACRMVAVWPPDDDERESGR
ncbi:acyl-CoA N-acyltransferase [Dentipellis sp. KUC8613]|nr:acyl-CoA N-acyltransferase [Dentipellis sp. KUC8613]